METVCVYASQRRVFKPTALFTDKFLDYLLPHVVVVVVVAFAVA